MPDFFPFDGVSAPARKLRSVTPADSDLTDVTKAIWVGGAGALSIIAADDTSAVLISGIPAGTLLPIRAKQIRSTGTTATLIVAIY